MDVGLKHLFWAFALFWLLHAGYLLNLSFRQKRLADELRALKESLGRKGGA